MKKPKIRTMYTYEVTKGVTLPGKSVTIPGMALSVKDILERFRRGIPIEGSNSFHYEDDKDEIGVDYSEFARMDVTELEEVMLEANANIETAKAYLSKIKDEPKKKADNESEATVDSGKTSDNPKEE